MQMKRQLTENRTEEQLRRDAEQCHRAGYDTIASILWSEADWMSRRSRRRREEEAEDRE